MSADSLMAATVPARVPAPAGESLLLRGTGAWRSVAYTFALLFALTWTLTHGKDVHWDALNYHLYLGFSALNDRFALDFFGAGTPSYINPYAYVPLWLMVDAGWPAFWIAVVLGAFHAIALGLTFEIALQAGLRDRQLALPRFALFAVLLAVINPVFLQGLGSTFIDISTGVFVLGGWLALARTLRAGGLGQAALAGVLCGVAAALKLSNAVFAMAAVPALLLVAGSFAIRVRMVLAYSAACGAAFAAVSLPWSWPLWREFANPFFPFLNHWFGSPDFTTAPLRLERYLPANWQEFLLRPFEMLSPRSNVHTDTRAPDLRYAALVAALAIWGALALRSTFGRVGSGSGPLAVGGGGNPPDEDPAALRVLVGLLVGLAAAWFLWLAIAGNSRYFISMACIAGVVLALVLQRLFRRWRSATIVAALVLVTMQFVQIVLGSDWQRGGQPWGGSWLRVEIPDRFRSEPYLYLSAGFLSGSAFVPHLHPASGMMNITGFNALGPRNPGGARAQALIDRNAHRLRILVPLPHGVVDRASLPGPPENLRVHVRRFGLRVDGTDCEFLRVEANPRGELRPEPQQSPWKYFLTCRLERAPAERLAYEREVREIDTIFDRVEDVCPNLFQPRRPVTQEMNHWLRTYNMGSEIQLYIEDGQLKYFFPLRGGNPIEIGSVDAWRAGPQPIDCSVKTSPIVFERPR